MRRLLLLGLGLLPLVLFGFATDAAAGSGDGNSADFHAVLVGANERPNPANSDLTGTATVTINFDTKVVCWKLDYDTSQVVTAAHIHLGAANTFGRVTFGFFNPPPSGGKVVNKGCRKATTRDELATVAGIAANPGDYYVNVHTKTFPAGAGRGQLTDDGNGND